MNPSHIHLTVNHLPFAFALVALIVMVVGFVGGNSSIKKLSLGLIVLTALACAAAYISGLSANTFDESFSQYSLVQRHAESAKITLIVGIVAGVTALSGLALARRLSEVPKPFMIVAFIVLLGSVAMFIKTSNLGGQIFHPETRNDPVTEFLNPD